MEIESFLMKFRSPLLIAFCLSVVPNAFGQDQFPELYGQGAPAKDAPKPAAKPDAPKAPDKKPGDPRPYADVITKEAISQTGVFKVHRIDEKVYWEIPASLLGRELLWQTELAEIGQNTGYAGRGLGTRVVKFTRRNNKIYLRRVDNDMRAQGDEATRLSVALTSVEPIMASFDVQAEGGDSSAVIDVSSFFLGDPPEVGLAGNLGGGVDPSRSYIERVKAFPENIETRVFVTSGSGARGARGGATSAVVHYSLVLLPEKPMMGRLADSRVGFFSTGFDEYGRAEGRVVKRRFVNRFRLEKRDPSSPISEPKKPIVFYLAREVPLKWRPYLKKGVEDWTPAFAQAGFSNAIICKDAPSKKEDPDWDAEDARYSVIRWAASPIANAMGPSIQDPRSGETLSAHIIVWNNIIELVENWYFSQAAATDARSRKMPFAEPLMGELLRYVIAHEVGHTLGLAHNFKASNWYGPAQLRDPKFTEQNGVGCSIMDYSRFNYVAQPQDHVTRTIGMLGPYDKFAIEYGYKPINGVATPDDEKVHLDRHLGKQVLDPRLRYGGSRVNTDPSILSEDIGGADRVETTRLGFKNLDTIAQKYLLSAGTKFGEDYSHLADLRGELLNQRLTEVFHVLTLVGGTVETDYHAGRGGDVYAPISRAEQGKAVRFLLTEGFRRPPVLFDPIVVNRLRPENVVDSANAIPSLLLRSLLSSDRIATMADLQARYGAKAYPVNQLVSEVTNRVWHQVDEKDLRIDAYDRSLQRSYLNSMDDKVNGGSANQTELRTLAKGVLSNLDYRIKLALARKPDAATKSHLEESRLDIKKILAGRYSKPDGFTFDLGALFNFDSENGFEGCWSRSVQLSLGLKKPAKK